MVEDDSEDCIVSKRYDIAVNIHVKMQKFKEPPAIDNFVRHRKNQDKPSRPKSEAEILEESVKVAWRGRKRVVTTSIGSAVVTKGPKEPTWIDDGAQHAAIIAAKKHGNYIATELSERLFFTEHQARDKRSSTLVDTLEILAIFKVCAIGDENIAGFSVCSPSDDFDKQIGTSFAKERYNFAKTIQAKFPDGVHAFISMTAERKGNDFGVISGKNKRAKDVSDTRAMLKADRSKDEVG